MAGSEDMMSRLNELVQQRVELERNLQNEKGELSLARRREFEQLYAGLQRGLLQLFRQAPDDRTRVTLMLEVMRILENRLVYLQNFTADPSNDQKMLASLVTKFIDEMMKSGSGVLTHLEATYYRAIGSLYAGDVSSARDGFRSACESEESDEANDIKYKSYVLLGNLSHEEKDYAGARELHDKSLQYSQQTNVTAQALAFKALNEYALHAYDEALSLFEKSLTLFDRDQPFFNSYFYRNALLFCGSIYFDRKDFKKAEGFYSRVVTEVEPHSYDSFDALSHLGKIHYMDGKFDEAASRFTEAVGSHKLTENEYLVDTYFWLARTHLKRNAPGEARTYLEKVTGSDVMYDKKPQAEQLLRQIA